MDNTKDKGVSERPDTPVKDLLKAILLYVVMLVISFGIFVLLMRTGLLKGMEVLMYRGVVMIILSGILAAALSVTYWKLFKPAWLGVKDVLCVFIICCCVNMVFFILVPVTVERSVSVFMLSYMDQSQDNHFTQEEIGDIFVDKYVDEFGAFEKRFNEQVETGTIIQNEDGTYSLTDSGRSIVGMFRWISDVFETDKRLVYPLKKE